MFPTDLQLSLLHANVSLLHANVWNLKISSVMFPTDLQLSLLHANLWNLKISSVMFPTDLQLSLLHANVWNLKIWPPIITFTFKRMKSENLTSNYHFYMQTYEIWKFLV